MEAGSEAGARRWLISGRVQGVGFRDFVRRHAVAAGLSGYAKNLSDGRVEVFAQGTSTELEDLQGHLHRGPRWSDVRGVVVEDAAPISISGFQIR